MKKILLPIGIAVAALATAGIVWVECSNKDTEETYIPAEEFAPAYNALAQAKEENPYIHRTDSTGAVEKVQYQTPEADQEYYDIEETVRILNGLEIAQSQSEDFYSFLEYMAKQDYSMVPKEVIEAKMELLPILQKMYTLEKENEELTGLTTVMNSLGNGLYTLVKERNLSQTVTAVVDAGKAIFIPSGAISGSKSLTKAITNIIDTKTLEEAKTVAFDKFEEQKKLKAQNKQQIEELKEEYLDYLNKFTPIYMKYINEWDRLCIDKDKAYLAAYSGRYIDCYEAARQILEKYPANREAMLLKALACINLAQNQGVAQPNENILPTIGNESNDSQKYRFSIDARRTLENYIELYPGKAAPALLLMGELELINGNPERAMSYFDQSAIEYPKQAAELNDMLNSYYMRSYLSSTPEGQYLMRLYCSTVEGYGWFSPNFHKARYWESLNENEKAATEIYNHFFRRDNQGLYDCLITDMEFCEDNLYSSFKSQFMESSAMNVSVTKDQNVFSKNGVKFTLTNNSDIKIENVRLFICLHLKDMYITEYEVFPCETINIFNPRQQVSWTTDAYKIDDIVRVRAVMMTDDKVCWVDDINFKHSNAMRNYYQLQGKVTRSLDMFEEYGLSDSEILNHMEDGFYGYLTSGESKVTGLIKNAVGVEGNKILTIDLPRVLCLLDPVFSIGELNKMHTPVSQSLEGSVMRLVFKLDSETANEPLYLYSNFINMRISYKTNDDGKVSVTEIVKI